jgi:hypothetical protein
MMENGQQDSVKQRQENLDAMLDEYETKCGLPAFTVAEDEAQRVLTISPAQLKSMTAVECGEAAVTLKQFAFYLQRCSNREQGRVKWAEESIKRLIAPSVGNVRGYSLEERRPLAVLNDDVAKKFDELRVKADLRVTRLNYLASKVESMAMSLMSLQQSKRGHRD